MTQLQAGTPCRALVAGYGVPGQRDLDFGRQVIRYLEPFGWPADVVLEDLSYAAHLVLHRLQELRPQKVVLVAAVARGTDPPGTLRRPPVDRTPPGAERVHQALTQAVGGSVDFDHTMAVLRHWGGLPADTVLVEVEPADVSFGLGFSDEVGSCLDAILDIVREAVGAAPAELAVADVAATEHEVDSPAVATAAQGGIATLVDFAGRRDQARQHERRRGQAFLPQLPEREDIEVVARSKAWGIGLESGSDWYDVIPLDQGAVGVVIGDVPGRGADAAALKSDLRVAAQAYAAIDGRFPARLVASLDRLVSMTGRGEMTAVAYLTVQPDTGEVRMCSAGQCPPLVVDSAGARYLHESFTAPLGRIGAGHRQELTGHLPAGATVLLFTDGLVHTPIRPLALGLLELREAALQGPPPLGALCDHVLKVCLDRRRRDDDVSVVGLRLTA